jgi:hypothetical protein
VADVFTLVSVKGSVAGVAEVGDVMTTDCDCWAAGASESESEEGVWLKPDGSAGVTLNTDPAHELPSLLVTLT